MAIRIRHAKIFFKSPRERSVDIAEKAPAGYVAKRAGDG